MKSAMGYGQIPYKQRMDIQASQDDYIRKLDMLVLVTLHDYFGFGRKRLLEYYRAYQEADERFRRYNGVKEPVFGRKEERSELYELKKYLREKVGIDYDKDCEGKR